MKVIFLDIDGVLNHLDFLYEHSGDQIDPECVEHLNEIVRQTRAFVVISSSWRHTHSWRELQELLWEHGFEGRVIGATTTKKMETRGMQIEDWIAGRDVESFVILDDDLDTYPLADRHVRTKMMDGGLTEEHVRKAVRMLEGGDQ